MTPTLQADAGLATIEAQRIRLEAAIQSERDRHRRELERLESELGVVNERRRMVLAGTPLNVVELAETVLTVRGRDHASVGDGPKVIRRAIDDLTVGPVQLRHSYFATKNYDRWHGQSETTRYGYSPAHGTVIFAIELNPEFRRQTRLGQVTPHDRELTDAERDAALAYLYALLPKL